MINALITSVLNLGNLGVYLIPNLCTTIQYIYEEDSHFGVDSRQLRCL